MRGAFFITARLGSKRLAAKHLQKIQGRPALDVLLQRVESAVRRCGNTDAISAIVTGNQAENRELASVRPGFPVYYGDDGNIPFRHLQAARYFNADFIVSVDGDDILCSPEAMHSVYTALYEGAQYAKTDGLPFGMNASGYSTPFLESSLVGVDLSLLETGWGRIFDEKKQLVIRMDNEPDRRIRASLDYPEDLEFFRRIFEIDPAAMELEDRQLIRLIIERQIYKLNESRIEEYWLNFKKHVHEENSK